MEEKKLDQYRLDQVQSLIMVFKEKYKGQHNSAKTENILFDLKATGKATLSPQSFRDLIGYIRRKDMMSPGFIVASVSQGYWYTTDKNEIDSYINQELDRMSNQFGNIKSVHQRSREDGRNSKKSGNKIQPELF